MKAVVTQSFLCLVMLFNLAQASDPPAHKQSDQPITSSTNRRADRRPQQSDPAVDQQANAENPPKAASDPKDRKRPEFRSTREDSMRDGPVFSNQVQNAVRNKHTATSSGAMANARVPNSVRSKHAGNDLAARRRNQFGPNNATRSSTHYFP